MLEWVVVAESSTSLSQQDERVLPTISPSHPQFHPTTPKKIHVFVFSEDDDDDVERSYRRLGVFEQ